MPIVHTSRPGRRPQRDGSDSLIYICLILHDNDGNYKRRNSHFHGKRNRSALASQSHSNPCHFKADAQSGGTHAGI